MRYGCSQLCDKRIVGYLPSHIRRGLLEELLIMNHYSSFRYPQLTYLQNTANTNNMTVSREPCGRWEVFWWIYYHLLSEHLKTQVMLLLSHQMCSKTLATEVFVKFICISCQGDRVGVPVQKINHVSLWNRSLYWLHHRGPTQSDV